MELSLLSVRVTQPACSCDCCDVVRRIPGEIAAGASVKCSPNHQHSEDMCAAQCTTNDEDKVLQDEVVDMQRFCFFECKPADGRNAPDQSQCVAFSAQEASQTIDPAGNPIDPAFLYGPAQQDTPPASFFRNGPPTASNGSPTGSFSNGVYRIPASLLSKPRMQVQRPRGYVTWRVRRWTTFTKLSKSPGMVYWCSILSLPSKI